MVTLAAVVVVGVAAVVVWQLVKGGTWLGAWPWWRGAVVAALWGAVVGSLAGGGWLADFSVFPPLLRVVMLTTLVGLAVVLRLPAEVVMRVSPARVVALQAFRLPLEVALWLMATGGVLTVRMTLEGRNPDIITGATAVVVAWGVARHRLGARALFTWNLMGVGLLLNVVSIAVRSFPGPLRAFTDEPGTAVMATPPFFLVPTLLVPTAAVLHALSVRQALLLTRRALVPPAVTGTISPGTPQ